MAHYEISSKLFQVRFYDKHPDKYVACFQLFVDGDRGFVYSLIGPKFYSMFPPMLKGIMNDCGVKSLEASVASSHADFMRKSLEGIATVDVVGDTVVSERDMCWIKIVLV